MTKGVTEASRKVSVISLNTVQLDLGVLGDGFSEVNVHQTSAQESIVTTANSNSTIENQVEGISEEGYIQLASHIFELVSFNIPSFSTTPRSEAARSVIEMRLQDEINIALKPFIEQMPVGAALIIEHECAPTGNGAITLRSQFSFEQGSNYTAPTAKRLSLEGELAVCLSALSEHFSFRKIEPNATGYQETYGQSMTIRPISIPCFPKTGTMGFTAGIHHQPIVLLPALDPRKMNQKERDGEQWTSTLRHAFMAARAAQHTIRIRIRLVRERLDKNANEILCQLLNDDMNSIAASDSSIEKDNSNPSQSSNLAILRALVKSWSNEDSEVLRVELEAETTHERTISESLLRILAGEVFPERAVEIFATDKKRLADKGVEHVLDFSNLYPLSAGLPPLLPQPELLETLNFARHYTNPSVQLPKSGLLLGSVHLSGFEHPVHMAEADRSRHMYILGATGTGKSTLLYNLIRQDIEAGRGVAMIDPHGDLFDQVLAAIPRKRMHDVIIIDPSDERHSVGLNPFDFDGESTLHQVNRVINDLLDIFEDLYDMRIAGGPSFEQYFRNTLLLTSTAPHDNPPPGLPIGPPTLLTAIEVLRNDDYRKFLLGRCDNNNLGKALGQDVFGFFKSALAVTGDHKLVNYVLYITNKFSRFTHNPQLRQMLCTPKRTVNFRNIMDERKILLVNLDKGQIGDQDTKMIGMLITKYLFQAAMSRSNLPRDARTPFYYYLDEFQNFVNSDIPDMLTESRKFGLHLVLAHQTLGQLVEKGSNSILDAVLGNVATKLAFRVGLREAKALEPTYMPHFDASTLTQLPDQHVLTRILVDNKPSLPFVFETLPPLPADAAADEIGNEVRNWSKKMYSVSDVVNDDEKPTPSKIEPTIPLFDGAIQLVTNSDEELKQAQELQKFANQSLKDWRKYMNKSVKNCTKPERGNFYWTFNHALVLIYSHDKEMVKAIVLSGGHGDAQLLGDKPNASYNLDYDGNFLSAQPGMALLGMNLHKKADLKFSQTNVFDIEIDKHSSWLHDAGQQKAESHRIRPSDGLYRTLNNSIVLVTRNVVAPNSLRATICCGGHCIKVLDGEKPGDTYRLSDNGQVEINVTKSKQLPTALLALASGMSLAERLSLIGSDSPSDWTDSSSAIPSITKRKTRKTI